MNGVIMHLCKDTILLLSGFISTTQKQTESEDYEKQQKLYGVLPQCNVVIVHVIRGDPGYCKCFICLWWNKTTEALIFDSMCISPLDEEGVVIAQWFVGSKVAGLSTTAKFFHELHTLD